MKTMKLFFLVLIVMALGLPANASPVRRLFQDVKLPNQAVLEKQTISNPAVAGTADILSAFAGNTAAAAVTRTTFVAQPDVPRNLVITPATSTVDVGGGTIVVTGTDFFNNTITENFFFTDEDSGATTGIKAFKTVTSVLFPANLEKGSFAATWSIGWGEKIGLKRCMNYAGDFVFSTIDGAYEATRATVLADATAVSLTTADFNGTMNGVSDFQAFFIQSVRCFP